MRPRLVRPRRAPRAPPPSGISRIATRRVATKSIRCSTLVALVRGACVALFGNWVPNAATPAGRAALLDRAQLSVRSYRWRILASRVLLAVAATILIPTAVHSQRSQLSLYRVKFICGERLPGSPSEGRWNAVAPGSYFTAINIYNPSADSAIVRSAIATTREAALPGDVINGPVITIPTRRALELDCEEILRLANVPFVKGFVRLSTTRPVIVVAVYTAADSTRVVSVDVEQIRE
jgi:hypothetical protein